MHVCVCVCVYMRVCVHACVCVCLYLCAYMSVCAPVSICVDKTANGHLHSSLYLCYVFIIINLLPLIYKLMCLYFHKLIICIFINITFKGEGNSERGVELWTKPCIVPILLSED